MPSMNEPCPNFEGNSDFYGLGIRIGIYLQWFSSWISNSVNPSGAAANHDTNTIFLCALLIATAVAFADGSLQLAEKYVLLLLSWGFFCTVLSFLGLRLRLLRPSSLKPFRQALIPMLASPTTYPPRLSPLSGLKVNPWILFRTRLRISFQPNSKFRHWALSWAGVIVRSAIGCFPRSPQLADMVGESSDNGRESGSMRHDLMRLMCHAGDWYVRYWVIRASEFVSPGAWDRLDGDKKIALGALVGFWTNPLAVLSYSPFGFLAGLIALRKRYLNEDRLGRQPRVSPPVARDAGESVRIPHSDQFWNVNAGDCPPFSQLLQALVSMLSRGVDSVETKEDAINRSGEPAVLDRFTSAAAHLLTVTTMTCFILFIERTILVAGISSVNTINATGQLIPFVTGVVSLVVALRDLVLGFLRNEFPRWKEHHIVFEVDMTGVVVPHVVVIESNQNPQAPDVGHAVTAV